MRPPSFKMELPPDHRQCHHIKPPTMPPHDLQVQVNQLPLTKLFLKTATAPGSDETDYSTSFADTASTNHNNNSSSALSDAEVDSKFHTCANPLSPPFDEFHTAFRPRKKKLTSHWRSFIRPVMWRCKWAELKLKQFETQALKYNKTIAVRDQIKHLANVSIPEGFSSRSMPFTSQRCKRKLVKRRKRVRVEDNIDAKLYMSKHILFSYHENSKSDPDGISITDDFDDPVVVIGQERTCGQEEFGMDMHNKWSFLEGDKENDDMEQILTKIDTAQTRVQKLKAQLDVVISENVGPLEAQTSTVGSPTLSTCNGGQFDSVMPLFSSGYANEEAFHIPDVIESTEGLPSSVDDVTVTTCYHHHLSQLGDSCENIVDNMMVHNQDVEAEKHNLRDCQQQLVLVQVKQEEEEEEEERSQSQAVESATKDMMRSSSSLASGFQIPKNKRKRGDRKAGTGNWSRQRPCDSQ